MYVKKFVAFLLILVLAIPMISLSGCKSSRASSENFTDGQLPQSFSVGPGGGGAMYDAQVNPQDPNNIFINCDMGSMFITWDGINYHQPRLTGRINNPARFSFSPHDENIVYAALHNIVHISHDKGRTWDYFFPNAGGIAGDTNDGGFYRPVVKSIGADPATYSPGRIIKVYAHPDDPNTVFALSAGSSYGNDPGAGGGLYEWQGLTATAPPTIFVTYDSGKTWNIFNNLIPGGKIPGAESHATFENKYTDVLGERWPYADMIVWGEELHMISNIGYFRFSLNTGRLIDHTLYRSASQRFCVSEDGKSLSVYMIILDTRFEQFGIDITNNRFPRYLRHIVKSSDFGKTFELISGNFATELVYTFNDQYRKLPAACFTGDTAGRGMSFRDIRVSNGVLIVLYTMWPPSGGWYCGVARSKDDGKTWEWLSAEISVSNTTYALGGSQSDPNHILMTTFSRVHETRDGGRTWRPADRTIEVHNEAEWNTTTGIESAAQLTLAVNPFNKDHHLAGWIDARIQESFDGGKSWRVRGDIFGHANTSAIAFDPHNEDIILAGSIGTGNSGRNANSASLRRSTDGGETWVSVMDSVGTIPEGIVFDPINKNVVYACLYARTSAGGSDDGDDDSETITDNCNIKCLTGERAGHTPATCTIKSLGVYKSADSGETWLPFNSGISNLPGDLRLMQDKKTLVAGSYMLDLSTGTTTWTLFNSGPNSSNFSEKTTDGTLYLCRTPTLESGFTEYNGARVRNISGGGAYVSTDNGATWRQIFDERYHVRFIRADTRHPNVIYLHSQNRVWVSNKGKNTTLSDWVEIPGFYFYDSTKMWEDPLHANRIMVPTNCGGTWNLRISAGIL